jgi:hypothetical protein
LNKISPFSTKVNFFGPLRAGLYENLKFFSDIFSLSSCSSAHPFLPFPYTKMLSVQSTVPQLHGDLITLDMATRRTSAKPSYENHLHNGFRLAGVEASVSLMDAGMNKWRFNFSLYGDHEGHGALSASVSVKWPLKSLVTLLVIEGWEFTDNWWKIQHMYVLDSTFLFSIFNFTHMTLFYVHY